ncbi:MAG: hypothetical protein LLF89_10780 [Spirochaetaceae bacterium]|nr:hypothetical protein [Spirochaetaceae bacterium]
MKREKSVSGGQQDAKQKGKKLAHFRLLLLMGILVAATVALVCLLVGPFAAWYTMPYRNLDVWVVDKTVPTPDYQEHKGLFWILKNEKIAKPGTQKLYDEKTDYFGFYPYDKDTWRELSLPQTGPRPDLIYLADTYGVYRGDFMQKRLLGEISPIVYGGLSSDDNRIIGKNLGDGNTLVAEFNTAASPTNAADRKTLGRFLGIQWSGWIGKYFADLAKDKEVPSWIVADYEKQTNREWGFFGRGFVLISDDDRIEVLSGHDFSGIEGLSFHFREPWAKEFSCQKPISYHYWFEWIRPDPNVSVVADYRFKLTESGKAKLAAVGLPEQFPAVMLNRNTQYSGYYFAGDFADSGLRGMPFQAKWIPWLKKLLADSSVDNNDYFYWNAYVPLMQSILDESLKNKAAAVAESHRLEP